MVCWQINTNWLHVRLHIRLFIDQAWQNPLVCHLSGGDFLFGLERFDEVQRYQECWSCRKSKCLVMLIETRKKQLDDAKEMAMEREKETQRDGNRDKY